MDSLILKKKKCFYLSWGCRRHSFLAAVFVVSILYPPHHLNHLRPHHHRQASVPPLQRAPVADLVVDSEK